jgi:trans-2,3-dihydro-3-hydroxyanthranilate isomerase
MKRKIYQVDAFTSSVYCGNPAGVVLDAARLTDMQMQLIASEMKLSETAFVFPGTALYDFEVRFFTPAGEVDLCGHATIATFHVMKKTGIIDPKKKEVCQKTKAGILSVKFSKDGKVMMRQAEPVKIDGEIAAEELCEIMGTDKSNIGIDNLMRLPEMWSTGLSDIILPVRSVKALKNMAPFMDRLTEYSRKMDAVGVHAFAIDTGNTVWCRNFSPLYAIPEEAATGTANGALGACLYEKDWHKDKDGNLFFCAHQGEWMNRPSEIVVEISGGDKPEVWVGGEAVIVLEGEIEEPDMRF